MKKYNNNISYQRYHHYSHNSFKCKIINNKCFSHKINNNLLILIKVCKKKVKIIQDQRLLSIIDYLNLNNNYNNNKIKNKFLFHKNNC